MNRAIDHGFIIRPSFKLSAHFSPIHFPMGNAAIEFFVTFALLAVVVGVASTITDISHIRSWNASSLPLAVSIAGIAWTLTLLAIGFACKVIELEIKNAHLLFILTSSGSMRQSPTIK
ncbi:hypothetical protein CRYUN_Cryun31cG0125100 [Craigia yunnanensis]